MTANRQDGTPRTDAAISGGVNAAHWLEDRDTLVEISRQLERELAAAQARHRAAGVSEEAIVDAKLICESEYQMRKVVSTALAHRVARELLRLHAILDGEKT